MFALSDGALAPADPNAVVQGETYRFTVLTDRLIRMEWNERGEFIDERTQLVVSREFPVPEFEVTHLPDGGVDIRTDYLQLRYDGRAFSSAGLSVKLLKAATDIHYSTWHYGMDYPQELGWGRGNLLGTARTLDNVDGRCELEPGILATFGFAAVDDSNSALLAADGWIAARPEAGPGGRKDIYLFAHGRDFAAALTEYHHLTGPTPVVPRYTLGNWWSRYWDYSADEYLTLMERFEAEQIPLSVAVIDMDWHLVDIDPEIGTGWTGYTWNRDLFPDPEAFLSALHEKGLAVTLNVHPADGIRRHEDAYPQVADAVGIDPESGLPVAFDVTSREFVDAYLRYAHHPLEAQGVDFWWLDWQSGGTTRIAGLDPLWMLNHIHFLDSGRDGKRPLTFSRYAGLGSHRYPVGFSGDTLTTWRSLDFQPEFTNRAANVGYTWWSHDIGGHMLGTRDTEMALRWFEYGVFSPINRLHSSNSPFASKEPWGYGPRAHAAMAKYLRLRHRLVPALYTAAWRAHTDAIAVARPMYHDHPGLSAAYRVDNQSMLGAHLLVAPITAPAEPQSGLGSVRAWLPEGTWFDLFTGQRYDGDQHVALHRPDEQIPVLARAGAVLPLAEALEPITDAPVRLTLRVFPGTGVSELIEDHGEGAPTAADRNITRFTQTLTPRTNGLADLELVIAPTTGPDPLVEREISLEIVGAGTVAKVSTSAFGLHSANEPESSEGATSRGSGGESEANADETTPSIKADELLSPALRIELGKVNMTHGIIVRLKDLQAAPVDVVTETFALLDAAEIAFTVKEQAWAAVKRRGGLALAQELATIGLPPALRAALLERAAATPAF